MNCLKILFLLTSMVIVNQSYSGAIAKMMKNNSFRSLKTFDKVIKNKKSYSSTNEYLYDLGICLIKISLWRNGSKHMESLQSLPEWDEFKDTISSKGGTALGHIIKVIIEDESKALLLIPNIISLREHGCSPYITNFGKSTCFNFADLIKDTDTKKKVKNALKTDLDSNQATIDAMNNPELSNNWKEIQQNLDDLNIQIVLKPETLFFGNQTFNT